MQTPVKSIPYPDRGLTAEALLRGNELPHLERTVLLAYALGMARATLIAHPETRVSEGDERTFRELAERRVAGEPIAYLVGKREFYGIELGVDPTVLIPRPETELVVDAALERIPAGARWTVLDLGTGSGAIALAIARHRPATQVVASDVSPAALEVARRNARTHRISNVEFVESNWYDSVSPARFELIVSNPPYVAETDHHLRQGDLRFEPRIALASGPDGLVAIRTVIGGAHSRLAEGGWLLFEHGFDQGQPCRRLLVEAGFAGANTLRDLAGIERVAVGRRPASG